MEQNNNEVLAVLDVCQRTFSLKSRNYTIGRDSEEFEHDICINHPSVDIKHSALEMRLYGAKLIDLFSKNGTFVDGEDIGKLCFYDIYKSVTLRFGEVSGQLRLTAESDSGFLGLNTSPDVSGVIPQSPEERSTERQNSQIGRSRLRIASRKSQSTFTSTDVNHKVRSPSPVVIVPSTQNREHVDIFANVTDENIRRNIEKMEEEDDFYVPETQEIFEKRNESAVSNHSQAFVRLCTQEFEDVDEKSNDSDNLLGNLNSSLIIPYIRHSPVVVHEMKEELKEDLEKTKDSNTKETNEVQENIIKGGKSQNDGNNNDDDDEETDAEEEMSALNWSESRMFSLNKGKLIENKSASVTPDLDLNIAAEEKQGSVTPDLELGGQKSGSVTPELDLPSTREHERNYNNFSPTQPFVSNKINAGFSNTNEQKKSISLNVSPSNKENLDETQIFILNKSKSSLDASSDNSFKNLDDSVFLKPSFLPKTANAVSTPRHNLPYEINADLEPTQPFQIQSETAGASNQEEDQDFAHLEATQPFHFQHSTEKNRRESSSSSPSLFESDEEENNSEFCLRETLVVGEQNTDKHSKSKPLDEKSDNLEEKGGGNKIPGKSDNLEEKGGGNKIPGKSKKIRRRKRSKSTGSRSRSKSNSRNSTVQIAIEDNLFSDILCTPNVDFLKLPNTNEIKEVGMLFNQMTKGKKRNKILLEESSSDSSSEDNDPEIERKQVPLGKVNKNIKKSLVKLKKSDFAKQVHEQKLENKSEQKDYIQKNTSPSFSEDLAHKSKGDDKKAGKNNDMSKPENKDFAKPSDSSSELRKTRSKNSRSTSETEIQKESEIDITHKTKVAESREISSNDDGNTTTVSKLASRTSYRVKSVPAYIAEDYFTEKDFRSSNYSKRITRSRRKQKNEDEKVPTGDKPRNAVSEDECLEVPEKRSRAKKATNPDVKDVVNSDPSTRASRRKMDTLKTAEPEKSSKTTRHSERNVKKNQIDEKNKASDNLRKRSNDTVDEEDTETNKKLKANSSEVPVVASRSDSSSTNLPVVRKSTRQAKPRIAFTRVDSTPYQAAIQKAGAKIVDNPRECTVLVAEKVIRTWKFLAAMARGVPIVSPKWLDDINESFNDSFSYDDYLIKDVASERHYKFTLKKSLHLAKRKPVFKDFEFLLTPNIKPTPPEMIQIIECGGGKVLAKLPKNLPDHSHFFIVSDKEDISLWPKFRRVITGVQIVSTEAVMLSVIQQCIRLKDYLLS